MTDYKYRTIRYIRTSTFSRIIDCFDDSQICRLIARRSMNTEKTNLSHDVDYIKSVVSNIISFDINFNSLLHGKFNRNIILSALSESGINDIMIQRLDVEIPESSELTHIIKLKTDNESFAKLKYIAHFVEYPCRRENETNRYVEDVKNFRAQDEIKYGFEPSSLDLDYIIPLKVWKDTILKKRISKEYKEAIKWWINFSQDHSEHGGIIRKSMESLFNGNHKMISARVIRIWNTKHYKLSKNGEIWVFDGLGEKSV